MKNKRLIVVMILAVLFVTNIFGFYQQTPCVYAKTADKKYYVKEQYISDLGKKFKVFKKKYGWTLTNGEFWYAAKCDYQIPGKNIWYTFQGTISGDKPWKMKNSSRCLIIRMKAKTLVKGFKGKMKINKFVSKLYSKKKKAKWNMSAPAYAWGEKKACITFYAKNGRKYRLMIDSEKERWISANDWVDLIKD